MKKVLLLLSILSTIFSCRQNRTDNSTIDIFKKNKIYGWCYVIMKRNDTCAGDSVMVGSNKYAVLCTNFSFTHCKIFNNSGNEITKQMKKIGFRDLQGYRIFQFYSPTLKEINDIKDWSSTNPKLFSIDLDGLNILDSIMQTPLFRSEVE